MCFPTKIPLGLKCVSKGWRQLIFDCSFIQAHLQKQKPIVSGFIFQGKYQWCNEDIKTVSYIPDVESEDEGKGGEQCSKSSRPCYYVCNPINKEWIRFKSPSALDNLTTIGLVFDPTRDPVYNSTKFKLIRVRQLKIETETEEGGLYYTFEMKMHLFGLELEFGFVPESEEVEERRRNENDVLFLNALEPHPKLEYLQISEYMGTEYPSWMISLTKLKKLDISGCPKVEFLPLLGKLQFLESLRIWHVGSVKVGVEFLGIEFKNKNKKGNKDEIIRPYLVWRRGAETAPIVIAKFTRLEAEAVIVKNNETEARAMLIEALQRERAAKRIAEKARIAQRMADDGAHKYKNALVISWLTFAILCTRIVIVSAFGSISFHVHILPRAKHGITKLLRLYTKGFVTNELLDLHVDELKNFAANIFLKLIMSKSTTILNFFKRKNINNSEVIVDDARLPTPSVDVPVSKNLQTEVPNVTIDESTGFVCDPGMRKQIWEYDANERDEIRRAYIKLGPYQPKLDEYKKTKFGRHSRKFKHSWFAIKEFSTWLEYSPSKDAAFCLPCLLFDKPTGNSGSHVFTKDGFRNWKKVNDGNNCSFLNHMGKEPNSFHRASEQAMTDLMNQSQHIQKVLGNFNSDQIASNRLRLKASINVVKVLAFQGLAFRGQDESSDSINRGNFLEILDLVVSYNEYVAEAIEKAPKNASYKSPKIQKEILHVFSNKVKKAIREEIGDAKFCLIVDEARDESMREQMAIVIRFVDKDGFVRELFFGVVHVPDTTALTLK
ncbi:hypothetical protein SO802_008024 [Lithocarpus litseifolius]|uniref:TTF-type domain-containing protein n=1 Tax=Lithocarpus litseifolius TaxID=425828 RepID=A0AAW2DVE7_9ROSI